jgi:hypothetical protein
MTDTTPVPWRGNEPAPPGTAPPRATDPDVRKDWTRALAAVRERAATADPFLFSRELLDHMRRFEATAFPTYRELLGTTLLWNDAERAFVHWAKHGYHLLARTAAEALHRAAARDALLDESGGELAALAFAAYGNEIKWAEIAGAGYDPVCLVEIRRLHEMVERAALGAFRFTVPRDEDLESVTLDSLAIRAMLLDAVCRGNLDPRQVEIVDAWFHEWADKYVFTESDAGAVLVLEPGRQKGLRAPTAESRGNRFLNIDALEAQIRSVVDGFRRGEIFPGYGLVTEFRVEEHTVALDFLRRFLESARYRRAREFRQGREEKLEALVGLHEILPRAFAPRTSPLAPRRSATPAEPRPAQQLPGIDEVYEIPRRYMRVLDESADGLGVEFDDEPARPVYVGTVVTLHHDEGSPPVLCEVMRRSIHPGGKARLGLRIISRAPKPVRLSQPGEGAGVTAIYVPSDDASGQVDSLLVAESDFRLREDFEVRFEDRVFVIRMNHVRYHGRGWHLAGFEVSEERVTS